MHATLHASISMLYLTIQLLPMPEAMQATLSDMLGCEHTMYHRFTGTTGGSGDGGRVAVPDSTGSGSASSNNPGEVIGRNVPSGSSFSNNQDPVSEIQQVPLPSVAVYGCLCLSVSVLGCLRFFRLLILLLLSFQKHLFGVSRMGHF